MKNGLLRSFIPVFCLSISLCAYAGEYDTLIKKYEKEIKNGSKDLEKLEQQIKEEDLKKQELQKKEKNIRNEINRIESELEKLQSEIVRTEKNIRHTKTNLELTARELQSLNIELKDCCGLIERELNYLYRRHYVIDNFFEDPWVKKLRIHALHLKKDEFYLTDLKRIRTELTKKKYDDIKTELTKLYQKLQNDRLAQRKKYGEKSKILKTTLGNRIAAEEEIKKLNQTANLLRNLIEDFEKKKKKTVQTKRREEEIRKKFGHKRHLLSWPAEGEVVTRFGKNKHPKLDTYRISNGIEILTGSQSEVKAVESGEVVYAKDFRSYGRTIIIDHGGRIYTVYGHLGEFLVDEGNKVNAGQVLGRTENSKGCILYFELRVDGNPEDPLIWLK